MRGFTSLQVKNNCYSNSNKVLINRDIFLIGTYIKFNLKKKKNQ